MALAPKEVPCSCGQVSVMTTRKLLCIRCGKYVFYDDRERRAHRLQSWYFTALIVLAMGLMTYFFVEMVLKPMRLLD